MGTRREVTPSNRDSWGKKLTEAQVYTIRCQLRAGMPQKTIAEAFDISRTMLTRIKDFRMWQHVQLEDEMTEEQWIERYQPLTDYPVEFEEVPKEYIPDRLWTLIDGDEGMAIIAGNHLVNRVAYYYTEVPHGYDEIIEIETEGVED